jgi:hypothetical protein
MPLRSFYARAQSLSLTSYNLCDFGEFTRMFDGGHAVLTVLLVAWRIAIGFRFVAYSTGGGFNLNLNGLLMD